MLESSFRFILAVCYRVKLVGAENLELAGERGIDRRQPRIFSRSGAAVGFFAG